MSSAKVANRLLAIAKPYQRIMVFVAPNETGGHAYLYRMLQTTQYPLYIVYASRRPQDSTVPFEYVQKSAEFAKALAESDSMMSFYHLPTSRELGNTWIHKARRPILQCSQSHGERPISYIFVNGHDTFGSQKNVDENPSARHLRLEKYWAPYKGALTTIAKPDPSDPFDHQMAYVTTKYFVSQMSTVLTALLPLVRNDGEGVVVLKSPREGSVETVKSQQMRANLVNPTPRFYESAVLSIRNTVEKLMKRESVENSPWPTQRYWPGLGDVFAKSAIAMYKSYGPFQNITFHRCFHNYDDIEGPVSLLLDPEIPKPQGSIFSSRELAAASKRLPADIKLPDTPQLTGDGIIRRVANPAVLPHNDGRGAREDWLGKDLTKRPKAKRISKGISPIRSVFPKLEIDQGVMTNRYTPFDPRVNPPIKNPGPESE